MESTPEQCPPPGQTQPQVQQTQTQQQSSYLDEFGNVDVKSITMSWPPTVNGPFQTSNNNNNNNNNFQQTKLPSDFSSNISVQQIQEQYSMLYPQDRFIFSPSQGPFSSLIGPSSLFPQTYTPPAKGHPQYLLSPMSDGGFLYKRIERPENVGPQQPILPNNNIYNLQQQNPQQPNQNNSTYQLAHNYQEKIFNPPNLFNAINVQPGGFQTRESVLTNEIQSRKEKLDKYRQKRAKRNYNRPVDPQKSIKAMNRQRSPSTGQFVAEKILDEKVDIVNDLMEKVNIMEQELKTLRESENRMKEKLIILQDENELLWKTVPQKEVFHSANSQFVPKAAFQTKIDFKKIN